MLYINISNYAGTHMRELLAHVGGQTLDGQVEGVTDVTGMNACYVIDIC